MNYSIENLNQEKLYKLIGIEDVNLRLLSNLYGFDIVVRDGYIKALTDDDVLFDKFCQHLNILLNGDFIIDEELIINTFNSLDDTSWMNEQILFTYGGKPIKCKTANQLKMIEAINNNDLTFSIGPAGTGKTFLAIAMAVKAFKNNQVNKIILTRPAVEAGESLGYLPGDLKEKIDPYLMPLYDCLYEILGKENVDRLIEKGSIEVMPLAYMRGRTLNNAFVILDEAQNTTKSQMLMFLTRLGNNTKMVIDGDITQIDLNISKNSSGLIEAYQKLKDINNIGFTEFNNNDIIRNRLVKTIIEKFK